jgi:hypothetical protein
LSVPDRRLPSGTVAILLNPSAASDTGTLFGECASGKPVVTISTPNPVPQYPEAYA